MRGREKNFEFIRAFNSPLVKNACVAQKIYRGRLNMRYNIIVVSKNTYRIYIIDITRVCCIKYFLKTLTGN